MQPERPQLRWPQAGDRLLKEGTHRHHPEILDSPEGRQDLMMRGYKIAADCLIEKNLDNLPLLGLLVYPIVFCYRQFLELALKRQLSLYAQKSKDLDLTLKSHDLSKLLDAYIVMCKDMPPGGDESIDFVKTAIKQFNQVDPQSSAFRYATDKDGNPYPISPNRIDIHGLKDTMLGMETFFMVADECLALMKEDGYL